MNKISILINCPSKFNLNSKTLHKIGGIESLNFELARKLTKFNKKITLSTNCSKVTYKNKIKNVPIYQLKQNPTKYNFDIIISSNDASIFNFYKNSKKIFWLHNILQVEKAIRKKQFINLIKNNPISVFVSKYLQKKTSNFFFFKKQVVISNFLLPKFINKKINYKRKPIFVWSVQRDKGLNDTIDMWTKKISPLFKNAEFHIYGVEILKKKYNYKKLKLSKIIFKGRVSKNELKKNYSKSLAMICLGFDETFCLNALEANACGLPILTFGKTALKNYVKNNQNGYVVNNYDDLSVKISQILLQNTNIKNKFIKSSIEKSKNYHIESIIKKWLKLLK